VFVYLIYQGPPTPTTTTTPLLTPKPSLVP
jgi:hypothetical protein